MPNNKFEQSRISEGTLKRGANEVGETARDVVDAGGNWDAGLASASTSTRNLASDMRQEAREGYEKTRDTMREGIGRNDSGENDTALDTTASREKRYRRVLSAGTLAGDRVRNAAGEDLGKIEEIMIDLPSGRVAYAVLSFGGFLGIGDKLFAVPWSALSIDEGEHEFILNVDRKTLENAPGFDKDNWPDMADPSFGSQVHTHYGRTPYWEHDVTDAGDYMGDNRQPNRSTEYESTTGYRSAGR
jgi:sporulation protein YlmC with PRC-barrel domain